MAQIEPVALGDTHGEATLVVPPDRNFLGTIVPDVEAALREQGEIVVELLPGETACEGPVCDRKLVQVGEHWIIDGIAGWVITGLSFLLWNRIERAIRRNRSKRARTALLALGTPAPMAHAG